MEILIEVDELGVERPRVAIDLGPFLPELFQRRAVVPTEVVGAVQGEQLEGLAHLVELAHGLGARAGGLVAALGVAVEEVLGVQA